MNVARNDRKKWIEALGTKSIADSRKANLDKLVTEIQVLKTNQNPIKLMFICTHNSRRSILGQVWAKVLAFYYGLAIEAYSGGTQTTAIASRIIEILNTQGVEVVPKEELKKNQVYALTEFDLSLFSKNYTHPTNPQNDFIAIMTCTQADVGCPFVAGAKARISLPYEDPKVADGTPYEAKIYHEKSLEIATELNYIFSQIK